MTRPALSNTGLDNRQTSEATIKAPVLPVLHGIDTLYLSVTTEVAPQLLDLWVSIREYIRARAEEDDADPIPEASGVYFGDGEPVMVTDFSSRRLACVLRNEFVEVAVYRPGGVAPISARVRFAAVWLHQRSPLEALGGAVSWLRSVFGEDAGIQVSEVHLCRDIAGIDLGAEWDDISHGFVMRARKTKDIRSQHKEMAVSEDRRNRRGRMVLETCLFGRRGAAICAEVYDKTAEIVAHGKEWFRDIWTRNGWSGDGSVWRVEVRLTRDFLREADINTPDDLASALDSLWSYAVGPDGWLRHVQVGPDASKDERSDAALSEWWSVVASSFVGAPVKRIVRSVRRKFRIDRLWSQGIGCISKALAGDIDGSVNSDYGVTQAFCSRLHWWLDRKEMTWRDVLVLKRAQIAVGV